MAGAIYRVEFKIIEDKNKNPHNELSDTEKDLDKPKEVKTEDIIDKKEKSKKELSISGKTAIVTAIAVGSFIYNTSVNEQLTSYSIQGDSVAARNLQNQKSITNELIGVGSALIGGALIGGPAGLALAGGAIGMKYAMKSIDHSNQIQIYNAGVQVNQYLSRLEQDKIQTNSKEFR